MVQENLAGLSPRLRGNPYWKTRPNNDGGSIPAPAGEPASSASTRLRLRVYPRACGGTDTDRYGDTLAQGLSPRLRGNRPQHVPEQGLAGSIPAPAGEPSHVAGVLPSGRVYPRACGGTRIAPVLTRIVDGLSPRLRGNPGTVAVGAGVWGSIPAPAGEPWVAASCASISAVYPRACGGTAAVKRSLVPVRGLSPRLRGNQARCCDLR